jgi:hypothetical protein
LKRNLCALASDAPAVSAFVNDKKIKHQYIIISAPIQRVNIKQFHYNAGTAQIVNTAKTAKRAKTRPAQARVGFWLFFIFVFLLFYFYLLLFYFCFFIFYYLYFLSFYPN